MPTQVTNYQCPACTGPLHFVGASGKLECEYCGASYEVAEIEALYAEKEEKAAAAQQAAEEANAGQNPPSEDGDAWDTSGFSEDWGTEGDGAARSLSATKTRRPPPVPTAETPPWCRGSSPGNCGRISSFPSS